MNSRPLSILKDLPTQSRSTDEIEKLWRNAVASLKRTFGKILVLDDDPTGSQTVYDLPVYTGLGSADLLAARRDDSHTVYLLTNSRSLEAVDSESLHRRLVRGWMATAAEAPAEEPSPSGKETLVVSRSDSTLRGHFPLETDVILEEMAAGTAPVDSGAPPAAQTTILVPFFPEGGRYTFNNIHYVREGDRLLPAAETEFAKDSSFGYSCSDLREYVAEKRGVASGTADTEILTLNDLRQKPMEQVTRKLIEAGARKGSTVIVNAVSYDDLKVFSAALANACEEGSRFVLRSAASLVKILAGLENRPVLEGPDLDLSPSPGILIAGSYVGKTTRQLAELFHRHLLVGLPLNVREALDSASFTRETRRIRREAETHLASGRSVAVYTVNAGGRGFLSASESPEGMTDLELQARISSSLIGILAALELAPGWVISKGGITSHDTAVDGLLIRRALVEGQVLPGVPLWRCGDESRWPGVPLVIFPGNVGDDDALVKVVQKLIDSRPEADSPMDES